MQNDFIDFPVDNKTVSYGKPLTVWRQQAAKLEAGEITKEEYDQWRYRYPEFDTTQRWAKVPSQALSDALLESFKDDLVDR